MTVGLVGAGLLGSAIAGRLLAAGHRVAAFDTNPAQLETLERMGGVAASSARAAAQAADNAVLLSLPDASVSARVLAEIGTEKLVIDTTTGDPAEMERFGKLGIRYVDATVAGSSRQVAQGQAIVMAGTANAADFNHALPLLETFSTRVFHAGPIGAGARMKLVVNLALGLNRAVLAEALAFAQAAGVDPAAALDVLRASPAASKAMDVKGDRMLARRWTSPDARLSQHRKDVGLILTEAHRHGIDLPMSALHDELLRRAEDLGFGAADNSSILEVFLKGTVKA